MNDIEAKNLPEASHDYVLPIFVCPFCGDKDHIKLTEHEVTVNNNIQERFDYRGDLADYYSTGTDTSMDIRGYCYRCETTFGFLITYHRPNRDLAQR